MSGFVPSGIGRPVVSLAAMSIAIVDLPSPGSPWRMVSLPKAIREGQSHSTASGSTVSSPTRAGKATSRKKSDPLPGKKLGGEWSFRAGDVRAWIEREERQP